MEIIMLTASIKDFTRDVNHYLDSVIENYETLIVNDGIDKRVVIMTLDKYNSLNVINHELSSKAIEKKSFQKELKDGNNKVMEDDFEISPYVKSLRTGVRIPENLDYKDEYHKYLINKHK